MQKVWFCAHEKDYPACFDKLAGEILSYVNCAVWYDEEPSLPFDEESLEEDLSLMQLFIMPVTERLLTENNRALSFELKVAAKKHIPVLPVLEDEGLACLFNEKCGNLQYLCPTAGDETTASYEEKLKKFLSSVLIGDELAQKTRDAFDAYIFLSYRKKDRKYANELMKLIHQNDFCRDVAIWYDEFLTPGENFDDAIFKAMQKSSLFALVVTPNLLEENNYVLQKEYPAAKKSGIRILPAEMVHTNKAELDAKYPEIPNSSNARDKKSLARALKNSLSALAKKEQNADPTHKFFIGLAYLGGIDVEVDRERALRLIEEASKDGLIEGTEKLIAMHRYGEGVGQDKDNLFFYQNRLVEQTKLAYEALQNKKTFERYATAVDSLAHDKEQEYLLDEAEPLYLSLVELCEHASLADEKDRSLWHAHALRRLASCHKKRGEYAQARKHLKESLKSLKSVLGDTKAPAFQLEIVVAALELAKTEYDLGEFSLAFSRIKEAENTLLSAEEQALGAEAWMEKIPHAYHIMANLCYTHNKWEDALRFCKKDIQWNARLSSLRHPTKNLYIDCVSHNLIAAVLLLLQRKEESHEYAQKSHAFAKEYYEKTSNLTAEECYAKTIADMGKLAMQKKDYDEAKRLYLDAYERFSSLVERTFSTFSVSHQASLLGNLRFLAKEQGNEEEKEYYAKQQIERYESALRRFNNLHWKTNLAFCYSLYAGERSQVKERIFYYEKSANEYESLYKQTRDFRYVSWAATRLKTVGELYLKNRSLSQAIRVYERALECFATIRNPIDYERRQLIEVASFLSKNLEEKDSFKHNLLLYANCKELLKKHQEEKLNALQETAKKKLYAYYEKFGCDEKLLLHVYDNALDYFIDRQNETSARIAANLFLFLGDRQKGEDARFSYLAAKRHFNALLKYGQDEKIVALQKELDEKISLTYAQEKEDEGETIDYEALVLSVFAEIEEKEKE